MPPTRALADLVHPTWAPALAPVTAQVAALGAFLRVERDAGRGYLPAGEQVLRAFSQPMDAVRVVIVGQDPYPAPGHAVGLAFSVPANLHTLPPSLQNIFRELEADLHVPRPRNGDLSRWAERGVLLLNRVLTVQPGTPGSHRGKGWEAITERAIKVLAARGGPLVAVLWGRDARNLTPLLADIPVVESAHPSPLSASNGFFGSRPYSRVNALLEEQGAAPIRWA